MPTTFDDSTSGEDISSMTDEQIKAYCERWENVKNFINSPGGFTVTDAAGVLSELFLKN